MNEHDDKRWSDDIAAYSLGSLDPVEAAELEHHLEGCQRCRLELRWLEPAARTLPESVERVDPPRAVRDRVMAEVRADARRSSAASLGRRRSLSAWLDGHGFGSHRLRPIVAMAAAALLVVAFAGYEIGSDGGSSTTAGTTITSRQPSGVDVKMTREGDVGTLRLANVRQIPDDRVLEAWVRRDGQVEPVPALFVPNADGHARTTINDMRGVDTVMVTTEPKGGSKSPTSAPIVTLPVPQ
jgi:anti-sigma factor RsiW